MKNDVKLKALKAELNQAKILNDTYKNASQAIPDPELLTKLLESHDKIASLELKIAKLKEKDASSKT